MRYAVPEAWYELGVRRWGFHGASHKFIAERSAELLGRDDVAERARQLYVDGGGTPVRQPDLRVISCHLGGSSTITGIRNGVAIGNSLGMSPQSGLPHNNRVGRPRFVRAAVPDAHRRPDPGRSRAAHVQGVGLESACPAASTTSATSRPQAAPGQRPRATWRWMSSCTRPGIGSARYFLQLNGADALVFTAGIGENQPLIRACDLRQPRPAGHRARPGEEQLDPRHGSRHQRPRLAREGHGHPDQRRTGGGARSETLPGKGRACDRLHPRLRINTASQIPI